MQPLDLLPIWTAILALGVFFYVALDGFDLGVGMLYNFASDRDARNLCRHCGLWKTASSSIKINILGSRS